MKRLLLLPALGLIFAGCQVTIERTPPSVSNLRTQPAFCTQKDTLVDFTFDFTGLIDKVEIAFADEGAPNPDSAPKDVATGLVVGSGSATGTYKADTDGNDGYTGPQAATPQAIIVTPVDKRLWIRAYNGTAASNWIQATNKMVPSNSPTCDTGEVD